MSNNFYVMGDVHAANAWTIKCMDKDCEANNARAIFLGDIVDRGNELYGVIENMAAMSFYGRIEAIAVGNHDWKIYRALKGRDVKLGLEAQATMDQFKKNPMGAGKFIALIEQHGYLFYRLGNHYFVHGAMHPSFYHTSFVRFNDFYEKNDNVPDGIRRNGDVAFYGFTTGNKTEDGYPERDMKWHDRVPRGVVVWKGHDALHKHPTVFQNDEDGAVIYLDTGSGKTHGPLTYAAMNPDENISQIVARNPEWNRRYGAGR